MREIKFEYGFQSVNGLVKKVYKLSEIPNIKTKCDVWDILPIVYVRQYTGLKDSNGKDIYEGDNVYLAGRGICEIEFPFIELYEACFESDIGEIKSNIHEN